MASGQSIPAIICDYTSFANWAMWKDPEMYKIYNYWKKRENIVVIQRGVLICPGGIQEESNACRLEKKKYLVEQRL